jgi:hypothetical protein
MAINKNRGPLLTSKIRGGTDDFPKEFLAFIGQDITSQKVPLDVDTSPLSGLLIESRLLQELTDERKLVNTYFTEFPHESLDSEVMLPSGLIGKRSRLLVPAPTDIVADVLTESAEQHNLGNGWLDQVIVEAPELFHEQLFARERQILGAIPPEFRSGISQLTTSEIVEGVAVDPGPLTGTQEYSLEQQLTMFKKKVEQRGLDISVIGTLTNYRMTPDKQLESITVELTDVPPSPASFSATTVESEIKALGGGLWLVSEGTVPDVFDHHVYVKEIQPTTPPEFAALLVTTEEEFVEAGIAGFPTLGSGELRRSQQQTDEFTRRISVRSRDLATLPKTLVDKRTSRVKQVETVTKILELDTTTPAVPTALLDVVFTKLGDGTAVEERVAVPSVFDNVRYEVEIPDVVPIEFRTAIPTTSIEQTLSGNASPPVLGSGDLSATDEQLTVFTHRTKQATRAGVTLPIVLSGKETTEEFGGGSLDVFRVLDVHPQVLDTGLAVVSSTIRDLGNGMDLKETKVAGGGGWPTLVSKKFDTELQTYILEERQVVDPSYVPTTGANFVEHLQGLDKWRSRRIKITKSPLAVDKASAIVSYAFAPFQFPGTFNYGVWLSLAHGMGFRQATAMLCKHTIKTWWLVRNPGPPTIGPTGSGADVEFDEIYTDTVTLPIYASGSVVESQKFPNVLHDAITTTQGLSFPATKPTFSQYFTGDPSGSTTTVLFGLIENSGTGYAVGNVVTIPGGFGATTVTAIASGGAIAAWSPVQSGTATGALISATFSGTAAVTGGSGTGATGETVTEVYTVPITGSVWIGSERVIAVSISPTDIPFLWKVQTKTVVMR